MAGALLDGLAGNTLFGLRWLDPAAALAIAALAVRGGTEAWREDRAEPWPGAGEAKPGAAHLGRRRGSDLSRPRRCLLGNRHLDW